MTKAKIFTCFLAIFVSSFNILAQSKPTSEHDSRIQIFPVSDIREGMRGTARTVFRGNRSEEFNVEILGVMPNWIGPRQDMIVGRLSGANAERTFVFAGMSGSPVYIDGKLVGAISYSFPFAKEPICGITPIEQMLSLVETSPMSAAVSSSPRTFSYAEFLSDTWLPDLKNHTVSNSPFASGFSPDSMLMAIAGQAFKPITTPVTFSGISQKTIDSLAPQLLSAGILPVAASSGNSAITPLKKADEQTLLGGDSVVVHLSRGDISLAAAGTVTLRDGDKIYAFGHPFFGLGAADLPMSESHVVTVVPNTNNSFKLAVPDSMVGAMTQDRATGIFGSLGVTPRMLPVKIRLKTSRGRSEEVNFESAIDQLLTPLIVNVGVINALQANERNIGDLTIELSGEITVKGEESIKLNRRSVGPQAAALTASAAAIPLNALLRAGFEGLNVTGITLNMAATDGSKTALLDRISTDRIQVQAGQTFEISVFQRSPAGKVVVQKLPVTIPKGTAPGTVSITVGDGNAVQQNSSITQFIPKSAAELIATINRLKRPDRLYAVITRNTIGAVIGSSEMPNIPPSMLATLNNDRTTGGTKPTLQSVISENEFPSGEYIVSGSQTLIIEIIR
ncbi:MAG: hypothetical protein IPL32_04545 [Chloracidobacterium sp.]|nr:hypothetical protein [Chloracidobacterium sp.]